MINPVPWSESDLKGLWVVTLKIDGIRALIKNGIALSREYKPLYNLQNIPDGDYEVFFGSWEDSMSRCRTMNSTPITTENCFSLDPIDKRLLYKFIKDPTKKEIQDLLKFVNFHGHEGLVLRNRSPLWIKVKPVSSYDVPVTGINMGCGRNTGRVGSLQTPMGNVGSGLNDFQRVAFMAMPMGTIIEVECTNLTPNGLFRHPRFIRIREDK